MPTPEPTAVQPKISQKMILRTAILLFSLAILFFGYRYFEGFHGDYDLGGKSVGLIAAIQSKDSGEEVVLVHPDGTLTGTSSWKDTTHDRDPAWSPDGKFLYFTSDRTGNTFNVFRWNPEKDDAKSRTVGSHGHSSPTFSAQETPDQNDTMLLVCGGVLQTLDPKRGTTPQVLPPSTPNITQGGDEGASGSENEFSAMYGNLGNAFRYGRWCGDNHFIAAVIERENGEVLIIQPMQAQGGKFPSPQIIACGDHVDFDVSPKDGSVVFTVQNFKFTDPDHIPPQFIKNNHAVRPFAHQLGLYVPGQKGSMIGISPDDRIAFGTPAISPDGSTVLTTVGPYDKTSETMTTRALVSIPIQQGGMRSSSPLSQGDIHEPCWSPDGNTIAFTMNAGGKRDIYTIHKDGSGQTNLTAGKGDFKSPKFSPQTAEQ